MPGPQAFFVLGDLPGSRHGDANLVDVIEKRVEPVELGLTDGIVLVIVAFGAAQGQAQFLVQGSLPGQSGAGGTVQLSAAQLQALQQQAVAQQQQQAAAALASQVIWQLLTLKVLN